MAKTRRGGDAPDAADRAAGGGLLDRRMLLGSGLAAGAITADAMLTPSAAEPLSVPPWMKTPGAPFAPYGQPSRHEAKIARTVTAVSSPGTGVARTPLQRLEGMITPNGLHFERSHNGVPDIDPDAHRLLIHGMVKRPLVFTLEALSRYPMESRIAFIECGGNSGLLYGKDAAPGDVQSLHGLVSCAEWTGVRLSTLLDEAGIDAAATWMIAEGADPVAMSRSIPVAKAMDDAIVALYQNGERIRPSNGYPMRLLLPGFEGNTNVKWLRRLKLVDAPVMSKDETSKYTLLQNDGSAMQFYLSIEAKSVITRPSPGLTLKGPGLYEISGLAWSGAGRIAKVEVSADGGKTWAPAALSGPVLTKAVTRFRLSWSWDGSPAVLMSRATDESGYVQPTRAQVIAQRGARAQFHFNGIASWGVAATGEVRHAYA